MTIDNLDKETLIREYITNRLSTRAIGTKYNCSNNTVSKKLKKFNIPARTRKDNYKDLSTRNFGSLTVLSDLPRTVDSGRKSKLWKCKCKCGTIKWIESSRLLSGNTRTCGCSKRRIGPDNPTWKGYGELGRSWWNSIIYNAKYNNHEVNINIKYCWDLFIKQNRKCALSGVDIYPPCSSSDTNYTASLDRIDSSIGYIKGNVQWVHRIVNFMKNNLNEDVFIDFCSVIAEYNKE